MNENPVEFVEKTHFFRLETREKIFRWFFGHLGE
jgi:hypothetical protein